jgi:uncharacterized phiE125 gp8 family phage protein
MDFIRGSTVAQHLSLLKTIGFLQREGHRRNAVAFSLTKYSMEPFVLYEPDYEIVTFDEIVSDKHMNVEDEEEFGDFCIRAARKYCETYTQRKFIAQSCQEFLPSWRTVYYLGVLPVTEIESITYIDENEDEQTLDEDNYRFNLKAEPSVVYIDETPALSDRLLPAITITYTAGLDTPDPRDVNLNRLLAKHYFGLGREAFTDGSVVGVPFTLQALLNQRRNVAWGRNGTR